MNFEKELRKILLDIIDCYQFGRDSINEEFFYDENGRYKLTPEDIKKFKENKKDAINYGIKKITELLEKAGIK